MKKVLSVVLVVVAFLGVVSPVFAEDDFAVMENVAYCTNLSKGDIDVQICGKTWKDVSQEYNLMAMDRYFSILKSFSERGFELAGGDDLVIEDITIDTEFFAQWLNDTVPATNFSCNYENDYVGTYIGNSQDEYKIKIAGAIDKCLKNKEKEKEKDAEE